MPDLKLLKYDDVKKLALQLDGLIAEYFENTNNTDWPVHWAVTELRGDVTAEMQQRPEYHEETVRLAAEYEATNEFPSGPWDNLAHRDSEIDSWYRAHPTAIWGESEGWYIPGR